MDESQSKIVNEAFDFFKTYYIEKTLYDTTYQNYKHKKCPNAHVVLLRCSYSYDKLYSYTIFRPIL